MVIDLHGWSQEARSAIYNYVLFKPLETLVIAICILMLVAFVLAFRKSKRVKRKKVAKPVTRGKTMTKAERRAKVKRKIEDGVVHAIEDLIVKGEITPQEAAPYYKRYANTWHAWGLLPKQIAKRDPAPSVKEQIYKRAVQFRSYLYSPVKIPGDNPPGIKKNVYPEKIIERVKGVFAGKRRIA